MWKAHATWLNVHTATAKKIAVPSTIICIRIERFRLYAKHPIASRRLTPCFFAVDTLQTNSRLWHSAGLLRVGFVIQIWTKPALNGAQFEAFATLIIEHLVASDLSDREVARLRMREIQAADGCRRQHGEIFGQLYPRRAFRIEQCK